MRYEVDAENQRVLKKNGTAAEVFYVWNENRQLVASLDDAQVLDAVYVYGTKSHVPEYVIKSEDSYQIVTDHLGSPVQVIDTGTGDVVQEIKYDAWGQVISDTNPGFIPFGFAGCLYDQDTKLCRFGARDYDASVGRWTSKDPIRFEGGDTNLYGYVMQDPVNFIDPDGLYRVCNRALDFGKVADLLYGLDSRISHTYILYRDGSTTSFGPNGEITEAGGISTGAAGSGGDGGSVCSDDKGTDEQERKMKKWAKRNINKKYDVMSYNCKDFARDVIEAGIE